ncbi:MAG TPA: arylesterase [Stellaceae bacterium]|nr:arylesterase [Stellaceae bacterium]
MRRNFPYPIGGYPIGSPAAGRFRRLPYGVWRRPFNKYARGVTGWLATVIIAGLVGTLSVNPAPASAAAIKLLALGDSLTAGYGVQPEEAFPARLQAALRRDGLDVEIVNAGVSGDTSAGGLARVDWSLADKPNAALVELGANDALRGIDPKVTKANLDKILAKFKAAGVPVLLLGMLGPTNFGTEYKTAFDAMYPALAAKYGVPLYPFFLDGVVLDPKLNQPDMEHPNPAGVDVIVKRVEPDARRLVERVADKSGAAPITPGAPPPKT